MRRLGIESGMKVYRVVGIYVYDFGFICLGYTHFGCLLSVSDYVLGLRVQGAGFSAATLCKTCIKSKLERGVDGIQRGT